jgi:hypothetical protein
MAANRRHLNEISINPSKSLITGQFGPKARKPEKSCRKSCTVVNLLALFGAPVDEVDLLDYSKLKTVKIHPQIFDFS